LVRWRLLAAWRLLCSSFPNGSKPAALAYRLAADCTGLAARLQGAGVAPLIVRELQVGDREAFLSAVAEFRRSDPDWEFAFHFDPEGDFETYVARLSGWTRGLDLPGRFVPNSFLVGVVGEKIVGRLSLRHELNDFLRRVGGHVGYGVVASERRKGYATEMLRQSLPRARLLAIRRLLVTCDDDNLGSQRTVEKCGGVLEDIVTNEPGVGKRRYWITL
jgi:predicted acetyltransferase